MNNFVKVLIIVGLVVFGLICLAVSPIIFIVFYIKGVVNYMKTPDKENIKIFKK